MTVKTCPKCGAKYPDTDRVCPSCLGKGIVEAGEIEDCTDVDTQANTDNVKNGLLRGSLVLAVVLILLVIIIASCVNNSSNKTSTAVNSVTPTKATSNNSLSSPPATQSGISDADYKMYNDIMNALYSEPDKTENEILKGLEAKYSMTAEELKEFLNANMEAAIARSSDKVRTQNEPSFLELVSYAETAIEKISGRKASISVREEDWKISKTNLRYVMQSQEVKVDGIKCEIIIKLEFEDSKFEAYKVLQLKVNGVDIPLK